MSLTVTLLGTGSPLPSAQCAGPATLISTAGITDAEHHLVDAGRGVLMRLAAVGLNATQLTAVLLTHLHSDHLTDLNDVITTRWVTGLPPVPLRIVGPIGTTAVVHHLLGALAPDIGYRIAHHDDLGAPPAVDVLEVTAGPIELGGAVTISAAPTDHRPVEPSIAFRFEHDGASVVTAGDTVPCRGLDALCAGADVLVHTAIRKDLIAAVPVQRLRDTLDYHSSPEEAARTARRGGVGTLVLTHYVPPLTPATEGEWRELAATEFDGPVEVGPDLHRIDIVPSPRRRRDATPV